MSGDSSAAHGPMAADDHSGALNFFWGSEIDHFPVPLQVASCLPLWIDVDWNVSTHNYTVSLAADVFRSDFEATEM